MTSRRNIAGGNKGTVRQKLREEISVQERDTSFREMKRSK